MAKKKRLSEEESMALARQIEFTPDEVKMLKKHLKGGFDETDGEQIKLVCSLIEKIDGFYIKVGSPFEERTSQNNSLFEWFNRKYFSVIEKEAKAEEK